MFRIFLFLNISSELEYVGHLIKKWHCSFLMLLCSGKCISTYLTAAIVSSILSQSFKYVLNFSINLKVSENAKLVQIAVGLPG